MTTNDTDTKEGALRQPGVRSIEELPLDRLRQLAADGPDAKTRADAKREIESRLVSGETAATYTLAARVSASEFGTPRPEIVVTMARGTPVRLLRAQLHEVAAEMERALAPTREAWEVEVRRVDDYVGAAYLELMDGTAREVDRAKMLLSAVLGQVSPDVLPPGPPGGPRRQRDLKAERERRKARAAATATTAPEATLFETSSPAPTAANDAAPVAATSDPDPGDAREARRAYRRLVGIGAADFEKRLLAYDRSALPEHAVAVLDGGYRTAEYWDWLRAEFESTLPSKEAP